MGLGTNVLEIEYLIDDEKMTDEEWEDQEPKKFYVTEAMILELLESKLSLPPTSCVDLNNFMVYKL